MNDYPRFSLYSVGTGLLLIIIFTILNVLTFTKIFQHEFRVVQRKYGAMVQAEERRRRAREKLDIKKILTSMYEYEHKSRRFYIFAFAFTLAFVFFMPVMFIQPCHSKHSLEDIWDKPGYDQTERLAKTLTRIYGGHFQESDWSIEEALQNDNLINSVRMLIRWELTKPFKTHTANVSDGVVSKLKENAEYESREKTWSTRRDGHNNASVVGQSETVVRKYADEAALLDQFPSNAKLSGSKLTAIFETLTGHTVRSYLNKKSSTFNVTGNLNLWNYFVQQSTDNDFVNLKKGTTLGVAEHDQDSLSSTNSRTARVSADGQYLLYDSQISGPDFLRLSHDSKVTVASQTSMDRLLKFVESYQFWTGSISLAVFLNGPMEYFLLRSYISFLKRCYPKHFRQTRFNIATPINDPIPKDMLIETNTFDFFNCVATWSSINIAFKKQLDATHAWLEMNYYPQNMMRNLARDNIRTKYHITLDVDIVTSPKMTEGLNKFLTESPLTNALVVPTYEISRKINFPLTKMELISQARKGQAQPFHRNIYLPNQNATNFPKWEKIHDSFQDVHVVHEVEQFPIHYEPFFVELNSNPRYDEGFVGYGFTRSSHAFEVFARNGNFFILSPIYTAQLGIKKVKEWSDFRQQQNEHNRRRFDDFIRNITSQYPTIQKIEENSDVSYYHLGVHQP